MTNKILRSEKITELDQLEKLIIKLGEIVIGMRERYYVDPKVLTYVDESFGWIVISEGKWRPARDDEIIEWVKNHPVNSSDATRDN